MIWSEIAEASRFVLVDVLCVTVALEVPRSFCDAERVLYRGTVASDAPKSSCVKDALSLFVGARNVAKIENDPSRAPDASMLVSFGFSIVWELGWPLSTALLVSTSRFSGSFSLDTSIKGAPFVGSAKGEVGADRFLLSWLA